MKAILRYRGVGSLLFAQTQAAFNDNAIKLVLIGLVQMLLPAEEAVRLAGGISLLLVAPFVLFAPLAGWASDRFSKHGVLSASLWMQLAVMVLLLLAASGGNLSVAVAGFFLLGVQAAFMSPARRGMVKELAGGNVGEVVGWMEMLCVAAILAGSLAGGQLIDGLSAWINPWSAAFGIFALLAVGCVVSLHVFHRTPSHPAVTAEPFRWNILFGHGKLLGVLRRNRSLWRAALGDSVFYLVGGLLALTLVEAGREMFPDGRGAARVAGIMMAVLGVGVAGGSMVAARLSRRALNLGLVPFGALGMGLTFLALAGGAAGGPVFFAGLFLLGIFGGLYLVPLGAFLVDRSNEEERGKILAASSMLSSLAGVLAIGLHGVLVRIPGFGLSGQLATAGVIMLAAAVLALKLLPRDTLRVAALLLARLRYGVSVRGAENLPARGGALLVCNHVSYVDTIILSLASPRPIRFLSYEGFSQTPVLGRILRIFQAIPISPNRARNALRDAADCIERGELVCIFPEGQLTRTGCLMELKSGFEIIARRAGCPVVVAHLDGLWGSVHSFAGGRYFTKWPRGLRRKTTVSFAPALEAEDATAFRVREILLELGDAAVRERPAGSFTRALAQSLAGDPLRVCLNDPAASRRPLRAGVLLALVLSLGSRWKKSLSERRVGILLPPGIAGTIANLALLAARKVPVNLNPSLSEEAALSCLEQAGVASLITTAAVEAKLSKFPWPAHVLLIERELKAIRALPLIGNLCASFLLPTAWLTRRMPDASSGEEAVLLFTSGSSGLPKGVPLSHGNLVTNCRQVAETGFLAKDDRLLTALPLFHSFGLTMGLFFPLLTRRPIVTSPSPLDCDKLAEAARSDAPTVLLSTPTFLRHYVKRIPADAFRTLRLAFSGAEKLPEGLRAAFRERFGCEILEGYGLTEASPVVSLNLPAPARGLGARTLQSGSREGSVGRLLPGLAMRLLDPETGAQSPGATRGLLALRGGNVVARYLDGQSPEKFPGGWYLTGDIVSVDEAGFLVIEGRSSRFSKIGGEMISHTAVEQALARVIPPQKDEQDCVIGVPSVEKGEELVLLTTRHLDREDLRSQLSASGVPNLWIPRCVLRVDHLPILGSGKLDLSNCRRMAEDGSRAP